MDGGYVLWNGKNKKNPAAMTGFGVKDQNIHKPNEQLPIAFFIKDIKYGIATYARFAEWHLSTG